MLFFILFVSGSQLVPRHTLFAQYLFLPTFVMLLLIYYTVSDTGSAGGDINKIYPISF